MKFKLPTAAYIASDDRMTCLYAMESNRETIAAIVEWFGSMELQVPNSSWSIENNSVYLDIDLEPQVETFFRMRWL